MSRKIFLLRPEERTFSRLPAPVRYAKCSVVLSCPLSLGSCNCSISAAASLLVATTPIYKRECQGKYSSFDRKRGTFLAFQPLSAMRDARLCCLAPCPWVLAIVPSRQLHLY